MLKAGDLVVSMRNVSAIAAIDPGDPEGALGHGRTVLRRQHDPDLLPNCHIMLFDNLGWRPRLRPHPRRRAGSGDPGGAPGAMTAAGGERFYSEAWGEQQLLPNGNVLITESYARAACLKSIARGDIVWSWVNHVGDLDGKPAGAVVGLGASIRARGSGPSSPGARWPRACRSRVCASGHGEDALKVSATATRAARYHARIALPP